jgi:enoyl-CoA hydratase
MASLSKRRYPPGGQRSGPEGEIMNDTFALPVTSPHMVAEIDGAIGWLTFNKPERRNAVSLDMWQAMPEILHQFENDPRVRVIVLKGAGDLAFVSGADISQFENARSTVAANVEYDRITEFASKALAECGKPTIAMIRGYCIGGGLAIAIGCDIRIATPDSKFGIPAARLGVGYGAPGVEKLVGLVGPSYTKEIFFTARHFDAAEAQTMGLINRVVPGAELEEYTRNYCALIADNAPMTMNALKRTVSEVLRGHEADWGVCDNLVKECFASQDFVEGRRAFMEKRRPVFRGF